MRLSQCHPETPALALRALNQIKHTAETFAAIAGLQAQVVRALLDGADVDHRDVLIALGKHPAVDLSRIIPAAVATDLGFPATHARPFVVMRREQTVASARVFDRGRPPARRQPYYRYFDTAVQHQSPFRPELIEELCEHGGDGDVDDSYFNNGHFESQMTVYLGAANLHWLDAESRMQTFRAQRFAATYKLPFVRHTFTAREPGASILAVTYLGPLASCHPETTTPLHLELSTFECPPPVVQASNERLIGQPAVGLLSLLPPIATQPSTRAYLARPAGDQAIVLGRLDVDRWLYHAGGGDVRCTIGATTVSLAEGDSACISPGRTVSFRGADRAEVVCFEVKSGEGDAAAELRGVLSVAGREGRERLAREDRRWFT